MLEDGLFFIGFLVGVSGGGVVVADWEGFVWKAAADWR